MRKTKYAVYIGRFQPVHKAHIATAIKALEENDHLFICLGSSNRGRLSNNPFTTDERRQMWLTELNNCKLAGSRNVSFIDIKDMYYSDAEWTNYLRYQIENNIRQRAGTSPQTSEITLYGFTKDSSSYYLRYFPEWKLSEFTIDSSINSTAIRDTFYERLLDLPEGKYLTPDMFYGSALSRVLSDYSLMWTPGFQDELRALAKEWDFDKGYDPSKYPIFVITVDTCVVQNGHVLVIRRKHRPGKGKYALPGGHPNIDETLDQARFRELREETGIDRSDRVLRANIRAERVFDDPRRSTRARIITHAALVVLPDEDRFPKLKAGDDADSAFWMPLSAVDPAEFFEDHGFIIQKLTAGL